MKKVSVCLQLKIVCIAALAPFLCACSQGAPSVDQTSAEQQESEDTASEAWVSPEDLAKADSLDRAIIRQIDTEHQKILFYSLQAQKSYALKYDSSTTIRDRYDQELVAGQLTCGDPVTVTFIKNSHIAKGIWMSEDLERTDDIRLFDIHIASRTMDIIDEPFSLAKECPVICEGQLKELEDINESDTLSVIGSDNEIAAIVITRGHGYVRLIGAEPFEGGWVEFGQDLIRQVEKDALYVVPVGAYDMSISKGPDEGIKQIDVKADQEIEVDVSDILTQADKEGQIIFTITPSEAVLKIDEKETDYSKAVSLCYGIHKVEVSATGYKSVTQYIRVGEEMANLSIDLEQAQAEDQTGGQTDSSTVSGNQAVAVASGEGEYRVYIDGPAGAELYVDDAYIGVVPVSFAKKSGKHTISLRREGYINRSYTLDIDSGENDNHYSFSSLKLSSESSDSDLAKSALSLMSDALGSLGD